MLLLVSTFHLRLSQLSDLRAAPHAAVPHHQALQLSPEVGLDDVQTLQGPEVHVMGGQRQRLI